MAVKVAPRPGQLVERHRVAAARPECRAFRQVDLGKRPKQLSQLAYVSVGELDDLRSAGGGGLSRPRVIGSIVRLRTAGHIFAGPNRPYPPGRNFMSPRNVICDSVHWPAFGRRCAAPLL